MQIGPNQTLLRMYPNRPSPFSREPNFVNDGEDKSSLKGTTQNTRKQALHKKARGHSVRAKPNEKCYKPGKQQRPPPAHPVLL